jgi:type VI protein secretion system component VasK
MGCLLLELSSWVLWVLVECCLERSSWLLNPLWEMIEYVYVKLVILKSVMVGCFAYG